MAPQQERRQKFLLPEIVINQYIGSMLYNLDINILRFIHLHRLESLDLFFYWLSYLTTFISIGIVLTTLIIYLSAKTPHNKFVFFKMLTVLIFASLLSLTIKSLIPRDRPFVDHPDIEKLSEAGSSSFPSGHTLEVFAIATALSLLIRKKKIIFTVFLWAVLVAYSRMALGVHYPGDVAGGIFIGSLAGFMVYKIYPEKNVKKIHN